MANDDLGWMIRAGVTKGLPGGNAGRYKDKFGNSSRTLVFGGRKDGSICVYNWDNGKVDFVVKVSTSIRVNIISVQTRSDKKNYVWNTFKS